MIYRFCDMIYDKPYDIISVPSFAAGIYHPPKVDIISKIYHPFRMERISLKKALLAKCFFHGALEGTRTPDLLVRSQLLYPTELPAHF